ncbi:hypothetical protein HYV70_01305 [Candidatus Uhrbacteria bacterium]|nr:hypothetical protein [Candidatus Uhrbacteria bacterium]
MGQIHEEVSDVDLPFLCREIFLFQSLTNQAADLVESLSGFLQDDVVALRQRKMPVPIMSHRRSTLLQSDPGLEGLLLLGLQDQTVTT